MSFSVAHRSALGPKAIIVSAVVVSIAVGVSIGILEESGLFVAITPLLAIATFLVLRRPIWLLYIVFILSASVTVFREVALPLSSTEMTLSGFLWLGIAGIVMVSLLIRAREVRVPGYLWPFVFFSLWAFIRWIITPTGFIGLKDILWYSMPVLFGLFVPVALGKGRITFFHNVRGIEKALMLSTLIPVVLYGMALSTGLAEMTSWGPRGGLIGPSRGIPLFLLVVLSLALGNWRYGPDRTLGRASSLIALGTILFTLGRMASFLSLLLLMLSRVNPRQKTRIVIAVFLAIGLFFYAVTHIPVLQQRFFFAEEWDLSQGLAGVNTAGRNLIWPVVFSSAMQEPLIGHGIGTARLVTAQLFIGKKDVTEYHPHNEYLQVFHDTGLTGLFLVLFSWIVVLNRQWNMWANAESKVTQKWGMASALAVIALLLSSFTDNTFHYSFVVVPSVILVAIADLMQRSDLYAREG